MKTCIINFSGRKNGNCHDIAKLIERAKSAGNEVRLYEFCDINVSPCGKCNYECFDKNTNCPYIADGIYSMYDSICSAELAYYVVPNYCDYPCANFFIFNERSQCYFQNRYDLLGRYLQVSKKFIVVSNTEQENFNLAFKYHLTEDMDVDALFLLPKAFDKDSIKGNLVDSAEVKGVVRKFI